MQIGIPASGYAVQVPCPPRFIADNILYRLVAGATHHYVRSKILIVNVEKMRSIICRASCPNHFEQTVLRKWEQSYKSRDGRKSLDIMETRRKDRRAKTSLKYHSSISSNTKRLMNKSFLDLIPRLHRQMVFLSRVERQTMSF